MCNLGILGKGSGDLVLGLTSADSDLEMSEPKVKGETGRNRCNWSFSENMVQICSLMKKQKQQFFRISL